MTNRALVIGSQTEGLHGVNNDAEAIGALFSGLGFETNLCREKMATRQNILDAYEKLIADSQPGDAAVLFYSGHGGLAANPKYEAQREAGQAPPRYYQFIVPFDIKQSTEDDFRGITDIELSLLLARLTGKTKNVTVILDCCHAARMSRDLDMVPKALPKTWHLGIEAHLAKLVEENEHLDLLDIESNPDAVRLVASSRQQSAFEYTNEIGERRGLLAEAFQLAMEETEGLDVSWYNLGTRVRERVLAHQPSQRPDVEGPANRILFSEETVDLTDVLPVVFRDDRPVLQGGLLLGVTMGDRYRIVPPGVEKPTEENIIAEATVREVWGGHSEIDVYFMPGHKTIPNGASAFPLSTLLPPQAVSVEAEGELGELLRDKISLSQRLRVAAEDEVDGLLARVVVNDGMIDLRDRSGSYSLIEQKPFDTNGILQTVYNLNEFARAQVLLNLRSGYGESYLDSPFEVEFGRVVDGQEEPVEEAGDVLAVGDRAYVKITNNSPDSLFCSVFDIGLAAKISLITRAEPSGVEIKAGEDYILGYRPGVGLQGIPLGWAKGVPQDGPRDESVLVIVSDKPQDLRPLQGTGMRKFVEGAILSPLLKVVDQIGLAVARDFEEEEPDVRYAVERIDFQLTPEPVPEGKKGVFLIEDMPSPSLMLMAPRSIEEPPSAIAIRLKELIVHSTKALFSSEIRVDNMVITAAAPQDGQSFYHAETARFPKIKAGDRLPLDNMLVYYGPVGHFVDMAIWVSRDQKDSLELADMIKAELNSPDFKTAALAIAALAVAAPQAAVGAAAIAGVGTMIQISTKLLLKAVGNSIGLYRTSFLPFEQFGAGQHPVEGVMTAQEFSFSYEVIPIP